MREASTDLQLPLVKGGIGAGAPARGPVAQGVGAVLVDERHGRHGVADGLAHLLAIGVQDEPRDQGVAEGQGVELELAAHDRREEPRADDVVGLGPEVHREDPLEEVGTPAPADLGRERTRGPGVHDVGVADEAARLSALLLAVAGGDVTRGIDREPLLVGE